MNKDKHILSEAKCRSIILLSRNVRYVRISLEFLGEGASGDNGVVDVIFWLIRWLLLRKLWR